jgi:hypothetical protein
MEEIRWSDSLVAGGQAGAAVGNVFTASLRLPEVIVWDGIAGGREYAMTRS